MDNVPDSTDWLNTPLACLATVDASLRCQVCKDFFQTPMITSCSHTFCSLCIRRALSSDGKCPLCRAPEQELKLRSNWSMADTVEAFSRGRPAALALARTSNSGCTPSKRKAELDMDDSSLPQSPKRKRTSSRLGSRKKSDDSQRISEQMETSTASDEDGHDDDQRDKSNPAYVDNCVPCPSCQKYMKAWQVFQHLEACPGPTAKSDSSNAPISLQQQQQVRRRKSIERLPALNYSILKEQALRKKLAESGLSSHGPRVLLERRHKEWINLWNANCDAVEPKKRTQLIRDLDRWERTQGYRASAAGKAALNVPIIKDKNFDGAAWAARHDSSFKDLIASARNNITRTKTLVKDDDEGADKDTGAAEVGKETNDQLSLQEVVPHSGQLSNHVERVEDAPINLPQEAK